jgi:acyl-CoA thioester hydrolase
MPAISKNGVIERAGHTDARSRVPDARMHAATFELPIRVAPEDIDDLGHVNNIVYLRWVQDAATAHWQVLADVPTQQQLAWVALRHEIDYRKAALPGDTVIARTWIGPATRLSFERRTQILRAGNRELLAEARTLWCPIDRLSGRPTQVSPQVRALLSPSVPEVN